VREAADIFVFTRFQPISPNHLHRTLLAVVGQKPKKQSRRVIVPFARAFIERACRGAVAGRATKSAEIVNVILLWLGGVSP
jgi:hypothetical protein